MIELYYWTTPNGHKITIFLEETGLPYSVKPINIGKGEQFDPAFLAISPNNRIPAIVDHEPPDGGTPLAMFESGAILLYLAGKTGRFYPNDLRGPLRRCAVAVLADGEPGSDGRAGRITSVSTRRSSFPMRSTGTRGSAGGCIACSIAGSPTANSSRASIPSPTWRAIRGSVPSGRGRT